jgi:uncharacterized protein YndB with AHSA1/START domain
VTESTAPLGSVRVTVTVAVNPGVAFEVFTEEIGEWYRDGLAGWRGRTPSSTLAFEPGVGGRLFEVGRDNGQRVERARVTVWEPGRRLVFVDQRDTEVDVRFEAVAGGGTRVVLEHRGLDRLPPPAARSQAKFGWSRLARWFEAHMTRERQS